MEHACLSCWRFYFSDPGVVAYTLVNLVLNAFAPFVLICIMNVMIIRTILGRQEAFKQGKGDDAKNGKIGPCILCFIKCSHL